MEIARNEGTLVRLALDSAILGPSTMQAQSVAVIPQAGHCRGNLAIIAHHVTIPSVSLLNSDALVAYLHV